MRRSEQINIWIFRIAAVLLCLTVMSVWGTSRLYARYSTTASGSDGARVARFAFSTSDSLTQQADYSVQLTPTEQETIELQIENDSETAVRCQIAFHSTGNAPLQFAPDVSSGVTADGENTWYLDLEAGEKTQKSVVFTVRMNSAAYEYAGSVSQISLDVRAEQLD